VDRVVQSLDSKLVIPVDMATEFMTKIAGLEGYQPADAAKLADQQVKGLAAMGQMFRITTMEDNAISSSLQYANGQVTLNGQKMPLEEFAAMFGLEAPSLPDTRRRRKASRSRMTPLLSRTTPPRSRNLSVQETASARRLLIFASPAAGHNLVSRLASPSSSRRSIESARLFPISRAGVVTR
jgi:hypothetical protein